MFPFSLRYFANVPLFPKTPRPLGDPQHQKMPNSRGDKTNDVPVHSFLKLKLHIRTGMKDLTFDGSTAD